MVIGCFTGQMDFLFTVLNDIINDKRFLLTSSCNYFLSKKDTP